MTSAHAVRPTTRSLWFALSVLSSLAACGADKSSVGGLVVRVESDLSMPKDFDRITLEITQSGSVLLSKDSQVGEGQLLLPAEFPIGPTAGALPVTVHGVAYSKGHAVIERTVVTPVPATHVGLLRLPLNYLCLGTTHEDGSSTCGADQTCKQGLCASTFAADADLSDFDSPAARAAARSAAAGGTAKCFDVLQCMGDATKATLDATCSFTVPPAGQQGRLNVAVKLPLGSSGICGAGACWVVLDSGPDGWTQNGAQVTLPASVCRDRPNLPVLEVAFSSQCAAKTTASPPCGSWSSITDPLPASGVMMNPSTMAGGVPVFVGNACEGLPTEACGDCGTHTRTCQNGTWSAWSDCMNGGICSIGTTQPCGAGGTELCDSSCKWGQCVGQTCFGPAIQACGNCGTQRRTCDAATAGWSAWGPCTEQGVCAPGTTEACGTNGTHACGGNCQWGACGSQVCSGAPSAACGNCGSQTRTCDTITAKWSAFSACTMEGMCKPNATRACGTGGAQICGGNCQWDATCGGQMCSGAPTQACGNCGAQTRACDTTTGQWAGWSICLGAGSCAPRQQRSCGAGGTQTCGDNCQWNPECVGQTCAGAMTETCGMCGTHSRTCDSGSGKWSGWEACGNEGVCAAGTTAACGAGMTGTRTCAADCSKWDTSACVTQLTCKGTAPVQSCGMCGTQSPTCDPTTGKWTGPLTACAGDHGVCLAGTTAACGAGMTGTKTCATDCSKWDTSACMTQPMVCQGTAPVQSCGMCGTRSPTCDPTTGKWTGPPTACTGEGVCAAGTTADCGAGLTGKKTCATDCSKWDTSACMTQPMVCQGTAPAESCGNCVTHTRTCDPTTGKWTGPFTTCPTPGVCAPATSQECSPPVTGAKVTCSATCSWNNDCACTNNQATICKGTCVNTQTDPSNCGGCGNPCASGKCSGGSCTPVPIPDAGPPPAGGSGASRPAAGG
jgi:hypothetical protein